MMLILREALARRRQAERKVAEVLDLLYPPGAAIQWEVGGIRQRGIVVMNCYADRIKVRNERTNKERFIYASNIVC